MTDFILYRSCQPFAPDLCFFNNLPYTQESVFLSYVAWDTSWEHVLNRPSKSKSSCTMDICACCGHTTRKSLPQSCRRTSCPSRWNRRTSWNVHKTHPWVLQDRMQFSFLKYQGPVCYHVDDSNTAWHPSTSNSQIGLAIAAQATHVFVEHSHQHLFSPWSKQSSRSLQKAFERHRHVSQLHGRFQHHDRLVNQEDRLRIQVHLVLVWWFQLHISNDRFRYSSRTAAVIKVVILSNRIIASDASYYKSWPLLYMRGFFSQDMHSQVPKSRQSGHQLMSTYTWKGMLSSYKEILEDITLQEYQ